MTITEIRDLARAYADRTDLPDTLLDNFLRIVEARIDKRLRIREQYSRAIIKQVADQVYYGLPPDFADLRDIQVDGTTLEYVNPIQMNSIVAGTETVPGCSYTIIANQLQVWPITDQEEMEIVYSSKLPALTTKEPTNWLSLSSPDTYVFGLLVEINAYVKDPETGGVWEQRFSAEVSSLSTADSKDRWSGSPLYVRLG